MRPTADLARWAAPRFRGSVPAVLIGLAMLATTPAVAQLDFVAGQTVSVLTPQSIVSGDFDGDGYRDLLIASTLGNQLTLVRANGLGGFHPPVGFPHNAPYFVTAADLDADGDLDAVTADVLAGTVTVFLGDGAGTLTSIGSHTVGEAPHAIAVADFDEDGALDLAVANHQSGTVSLLGGDGLGGFSALGPALVYENPSFVVAEDFDLDGHIDLAITSSLDSNFSVRYGNGVGAFPFQLNYSIGIDDSLWHATAHDLTGDGRPDLVFPCPAFDFVAIYVAQPAGGFLAGPQVACGDQPRETMFRDLNSDGVEDLVAMNPGSTDLTLALAGSGGLFAAPMTYAAGPDPVSLAGLDIDQDGQQDLIVANKIAGTLTVLLNRTQTTVEFRRGDADGDGAIAISDAIAQLAALFGAVTTPLGCPDAGDFDDDGAFGVGDPISLLAYLFASGPAAAPPSTTCGTDPTPDPLPYCGVSPSCP